MNGTNPALAATSVFQMESECMSDYEMAMNEETRTRFLASIKIQSPQACWQWLGPKTGQQYPVFYCQGMQVSAVRLLWQVLTHRTIPEGQIITHTCGTVGCMNPGHIQLMNRSELRTFWNQREIDNTHSGG